MKHSDLNRNCLLLLQNSLAFCPAILDSKPAHTVIGKVKVYYKENKIHLPKDNMYIQVHDTCSSVKCGSDLQWINITDRLVCLCLECAIGTHS